MDTDSVPQINKVNNYSVRVDPAYVILASHQPGAVAAYRLYVAMCAMDTSGRRYLDKNDVFDKLPEYSLDPHPDTYQNWLQNGLECGFWTFEGDMLRITGEREGKLFKALAKPLIEAGKADIVEAARPSTRKVYITLDGSLADFIARAYKAWIGQGKNGRRDWSRKNLCRFWNVSLPTLLSWERKTGVNVRHNIEQTANPETASQWKLEQLDGIHGGAISEHDQDGLTVWSRQGINTYAATVTEHPHKGTQRKIRAFTNAYIEAVPVDSCSDGLPATVRKVTYDGDKRVNDLRRDSRKDPFAVRRGFVGTDVNGWGVYEVFDSQADDLVTQVIEPQSLRAVLYDLAERRFEAGIREKEKSLPPHVVKDTTPLQTPAQPAPARAGAASKPSDSPQKQAILPRKQDTGAVYRTIAESHHAGLITQQQHRSLVAILYAANADDFWRVSESIHRTLVTAALWQTSPALIAHHDPLLQAGIALGGVLVRSNVNPFRVGSVS